MIRKLGHWVHDYLYAVHQAAYSFIYRGVPRHYLGYVVSGRPPIILIPGIYEKWHSLKAFADPLSRRGHPVYALTHLGYNTGAISRSAQLVRELIEEQKLRKVIILAHSKGGLIGKAVLAFHNRDNRVRKVIAIASPFGGSYAVNYFPIRTLRELHPSHETIRRLQQEKTVNRHIVSIFGVFDNHVWPEDSCRLPGARNIEVNVHGHHKILFDREVRRIVLAEVN